MNPEVAHVVYGVAGILGCIIFCIIMLGILACYAVRKIEKKEDEQLHNEYPGSPY